MSRWSIVASCSLVFAIAAAGAQYVLLPTGWRISPPTGAVTAVGTMPQGIALSPDGTKLAVVEAGFNPPALRILDASDLHSLRDIALKDAFGIPVWDGNHDLVVAGASLDAVLRVNVDTGDVSQAWRSTGWTAALAYNRFYGYAAADDANNSVTVGSICTVISNPHCYSMENPKTVATGQHPGAVLYSRRKLYVANRGEATLTRISLQGPWADPPQTGTIAVDLHPAALELSPDGSQLFVACSDADVIDVVDTTNDRVIQRIDVGLPTGRGASPNGLAVATDGTLYVSLGAENAVAEIRNGAVVARVPAGWYPTGVAVDANTVYVVDGKGESSHPNPQFNPEDRKSGGYVAAILSGSVRAIARTGFTTESTAAVVADVPSPKPTPAQTVVRPNGPIRHVIYIIKENRTYDEVLGDVKGADGDPALVWFGAKITPNQHTFAERFGVFDNTYTDGQISASGHNWTDAAFANDYLERFWPPNYGGRRDLYDFEDGAVAAAPGTGYIWDDAAKHHVSLRDYGEHTSDSVLGFHMMTTSAPNLKNNLDAKYRGWDLTYSDENRVDEWKREFAGYVRNDDLPALEIVWLPNDHTSGTKPGALTPSAMVAQNDHAFGRIVDAVSHSKYWKSTAIFAIEDDAQNGPDHVDDQRTTFYLVSPYAAKGVHHAHYSTTGVVRTIELLLGLPPMNVYDAVAPPLYDAFAIQPNLAPFNVIAPRIDDTQRNLRTAYGAMKSAGMNFSREDAVDPATLNDILAHAAHKSHR